MNAAAFILADAFRSDLTRDLPYFIEWNVIFILSDD